MYYATNLIAADREIELPIVPIKYRGLVEFMQNNVQPTKEAIAAHLNISRRSVDTYLYEAKAGGYLRAEETAYFMEVQAEQAWHHIIANLIKEKADRDTIYRACEEFNEGWYEKSAKEKRQELTKIIQRSYVREQLESKDVKYLKLEKTVIARRGCTKGVIRDFLIERANGQPTANKKALLEEFNDYAILNEILPRAIHKATFEEHVKNMDDLPQGVKNFINLCTDQTRSHKK